MPHEAGSDRHDSRTKFHNQMVAVLYRVAFAADNYLFGQDSEAKAGDDLERALDELTAIRPAWREKTQQLRRNRD